MSLDHFNTTLSLMNKAYRDDPIRAVRGQIFVKILHDYIAADLHTRLRSSALKRGVEVKKEATIFGSFKPKDVDVCVIEPNNGPLVIVGVRSQMSSVSKNILNYYQDIIGECISLQDRFPMATICYAYLMPVTSIKAGKEKEYIDHLRYSRLYSAITGRSGIDYKSIRGVYDQFAYAVVDFEKTPPLLRDDLFTSAETESLSITTFVDRIVATHNHRHQFLEIFK